MEARVAALFVRVQIVHDDDILFAEGGGQLGLDIGFEAVAVYRAVDHPRKGIFCPERRRTGAA